MGEIIRKTKKSQLTVFIIIAIVIVLVIVGAFFIIGANKPKITAEAITQLNQDINKQVSSCLKTTSENGITLISRQGGYYKPKNAYAYSGSDQEPGQFATTLKNINISYYMLGSKNYFPTNGTVEKEISAYIMDNLPKCVQIDKFKNRGFNIEEDKKIIKTTITDSKVFVDLEYPITLSGGELRSTLSKFSSETNTRLGVILNLTSIS